MKIRNTRKAAVTLPGGPRIEGGASVEVTEDEWLSWCYGSLARAGYVVACEPEPMPEPEPTPVAAEAPKAKGKRK